MPFDTLVSFGTPATQHCDLLALCVREGALIERKIADEHLGDLDRALSGLVSRCAAEEEFKGKDGQSLSLHTHGRVPAPRLLVLGLGRHQDPGRALEALRQAASRAVKAARAAGARTLAVGWPQSDDPERQAREVQALAEGLTLGAYRFDRYLKEKKAQKLVRAELLARDERRSRRGQASPAGATAAQTAGAPRGAAAAGRATVAQGPLAEAAALGKLIAEATCHARDLVNEPAGKLTPRALAAAARAVARDHGLQIEVLGRAGIRKLGMELFLAVAQGSDEEPQLVRMRYTPKQKGVAGKGAAGKGAAGKGAAETDAAQKGAAGEGAAAGKPLALVGKAITFDSGGLSLKTAQGMEGMKVDMAGAAAVIAAMGLAARLAPPFPVHGYFGACENLPSGTAYKPGDVINSKGGLSVEVLNTDAEGRLVLADVLAWAVEEEPAAVIDLATLTGAIMVALGPWTGGLFCNDEALAAELEAAASAAGESIWRMPLPPEMDELIKSPIADLKNIGGRHGGAIAAALFLQRFVGKVPWAHLDIAGPAALEKEKGYNPRGGTGTGVRLLFELIRRRAGR